MSLLVLDGRYVWHAPLFVYIEIVLGPVLSTPLGQIQPQTHSDPFRFQGFSICGLVGRM